MVDQDPNFLNLQNQSSEDDEINNLLNEYYDVEFGSSFDILREAQKARTEQRERKKSFDAAARENGYTPEVLYSATEMDITSITGRNAKGLRASVADIGSESDKYFALRNAQRNIATGGVRYVTPDGDAVLFNEVGARTGAFGLVDNIRANVKDSQALLGVSFLAPFLSDEVKAKLETIRSDLDNTYGVNPHLAQMRESAKGTIKFWDDVTERAKLKKDEVKSILADAAPPGGEYTNDWLWSTLSSDSILSEMFSNASVTKENTLANIDQDSPGAFVKGMEAVAQRLYEHQQFQTSMALSEDVEVGIGASLLDMLVQDPDFAAEMTFEGLGFIAAQGLTAVGAISGTPFTGGGSLVAGGAASAGLWTAFTVKWGNRLGKIARKSNNIKKKIEKLNNLKNTQKFGPLNTIGRTSHLLLRVKPGSLSMGGNVADLITDTIPGLTGIQKLGIWAAGQSFDGFVGGASAHAYSNAERKSVLSYLYNEGEDIGFTDDVFNAGLIGAGFSLGLGVVLKYGTRGTINLAQRGMGVDPSNRTSFLDEDNVSKADYHSQQKQLWERVMDPKEGSYDSQKKTSFLGWIKGEDAGTKLLLSSIRQRARMNIMVSLLSDGDVKSVDELKSKFGFTDSLANTIFEHDLEAALSKAVENTKAEFGDGTTIKDSFPGFGATGIRLKLLEDNEFMAALRNKDGDKFTSEEVELFREKHYAHLAAEEEKLGIDAEYQAIIKTVKDPVKREEKVRELIERRILETEQGLQDLGNKETKALERIRIDAADIEDAEAEIERLIPTILGKLDKTEEGRATADNLLSNFASMMAAPDTLDYIAKLEAGLIDLTPEQKAILNRAKERAKINNKKMREAGAIAGTLPSLVASIDVKSDIKTIYAYARQRGINLEKMKGRSRKSKNKLNAIVKALTSSDLAEKEAGIKRLEDLILAERADVQKLLDKLEELRLGVKDKVDKLGNARKRGKKREKVKSVISQVGTFLEERLEKLREIQLRHDRGELNTDPDTQGDIPSNAGFRDSSGIIEEQREVELNKNFSKYSLDVKVTSALTEAFSKSNGTISRALALDIFRGFIAPDHKLFKKKTLTETEMRQLLAEANEVIDNFEVTDQVIQQSISQRRSLYDTADVEAGLEMDSSKAKQANEILKSRLQGIKMGDPSRFVAPRIRSDAQATLETNNARATASRSDYTVEGDVEALNEALVKMEALLMRLEHAAVSNTGRGSRSAIMSLFKNTVLEDIDIDAVFGEALEETGKTRDFDQFNLEEVFRIMRRRKDLGERYLNLEKTLDQLDEKYSKKYAFINKAMTEAKSNIKTMTARLAGKEPLLEGETPESLKESLDNENAKFLDLQSQREQLYVQVETARTEAGVSSEKTPDQLRLEQSQLLTELRKQEAMERKNLSGKPVNGASDEDAWVDAMLDSFVDILRNRKDVHANRIKTREDATNYIIENVIPYLPIDAELKNSGIKAIAALGNGELDWITPKTAAFAVRSMVRDEVDGTKRWDMEVTEWNDDTNSYETRKVQSEQVKSFSAVQPATDIQISRVLDQITYEAKVRAINELDFDDPNGPSEAEIIAFIKDGNLRQNMSTAQDRSQLTIHADQIPPLVRTDIDRKLPEGKDYLDDYIDRTVEQMMELPPAHYSFIHDDLKGLKGQFGIRMEDVNTKAFFRYSIQDSANKDNPWAEADPTGGFPVAIPLPDVDGNYSIAMAILDASAMLYPEMTPEILAAFRRGDNINNAAKDSTGRGSALIAGQDGQNNGSRHQVAESIVFRRRNKLAEMSEQEAEDLINGLLETEGSTPDDFYTNLILEIGKELDSDNKTFTPEVRNALKELNKVGEGEFWRSGNKQSRDLAKQPLMIIPYGAQRRGVLGALNAWFSDNPTYKKALEEAAKKSGTNYKVILNELTTSMLGNKNKAIDSLVERASGMPDSAARLDAVLGMRDSLLPKVFDEKAKNYVEWDSKQGMEILYAQARSLAEKVTESPTEKEIDVVFRALQIEAFANALLRKEQFDAMGKKINGIDEAMNTSRLHFIKELSVIEELTEARENGDIERFNSLASKISGSKLTFFDRTTQTMNRTAFTVARDDPSVKHVMAMTGQDAETGIAPSRALENVDDVIYINNLIDWRTRYVSPPRKEMDHKGEKSRRVILDPFMFVEEADATYKTSEEAALADLKKVELYYEDPKAKGAMSHQDWYNKHVDQGKAFAGGIYDIKDMGKLTARERILKNVEEMTPDQLREEFQKINQQRAKQGKPVLSVDSSVDDIAKARLELEETRVRRLALKNAMIMMAPEIDPPLRKNADGTLSQVPSITREEAYRRWRVESDDIEASAKRIKENKIDSESREYKKRFGNPWTSNYDRNGDLELDRLEDGRNLDPSNLQTELMPQTPKTKGGGLGFRAIHPTQHIDSMLGVPALREAHQVKNMGFSQELKLGKKALETTGDSTRLNLANRKLTAERNTTNIDSNLQENGVLFDIDERNRVDFTDNEFLADVDVDIAGLAKSDVLGVNRSPEQLDIMVKDILTKHAEKFGLTDLLGKTQVRTVTRTIEVEETIEGTEEVAEDDLDSLNVGQTKTRAQKLKIKGYTKYNSKNIDELKNKIREVEALRKSKPTTRTVTRTITEEIEEPGGEPRWDLIYGHQIWMKNIENYNREVSAFEKKLDREAKDQNLSHEEREMRLKEGIKTLRQKWQDNIDKRVEDFETTANNPYDSNAIDPFQNIRTFRTSDKQNNRLTFREALLSVSEDERRRSNVGLVDPEGSLQGMRLDEGSIFSSPAPERRDPVGFVKDDEGKVIRAEDGEMVEQTGLLNVTGQATPPAGFATGFRNEAGEYIDIENLNSNQAFSVAITHAKDATMLRNVVAAHMSRINGEDFNIEMLDGVMELTIPGSQVKDLLEEVALIPGADKNVRFNINGVDIISGRIFGHQTRRIASANQSRHILQLSANRYVGDMLLVSGLASGDIKRVVARHKKMDNHLHETRDFATNLNNETQIILGFLQRNGAEDKISSSSFHGTRYIDLKKMWDDNAFRDRVILSTLEAKDIEARKVLNLKPEDSLDIISPYEVTVSRMRTIYAEVFTAKGSDRIMRQKINAGEEPLIKGSEPMFFTRSGEEYIDFKQLRDRLNIKSKAQFEALVGESVRIDKINRKDYLSKEEFIKVSRILKNQDEAIQAGDSSIGRHSLDNLKAAEGLSDTQVLNAKRLAGLSLMGGRSPTIIDSNLAKAYNIDMDAETLALAEEILAKQRILEHGLDIASGDGIIRQGYGPIVLRVIQEDLDIQRKVMSGEELTEADYQKLYQAWLDYEPGRPGSPERVSLENKGSIRDGAGRAGLKSRIDQGVKLAKRVMEENETDPETGKTLDSPFYTGEYPKKNDGTPGDAIYFMNKQNFNGISEDHAAINTQFENLVKHGTLTVREVKMLRAVLSQMEGKLLKNLDFVEDTNIRDAAAKIAEAEGIDAPNFGGRSPAGFIETSKTGVALHLLKGRLGRELTAVDVILHEIAHAAQVRLYDEGFAEWHVTNGLLNNPEAPKLIENLTVAMNGGIKDGKALRQIEFYQQNPDEFMAALFSYNMQARTFKDRLTLEKAYEAGDEIIEGSSNIIRRILQKMINYSYRKIIHIKDTFLKLDPSYRAQIDVMTDVLLGKGEMPVRDLGDTPELMFNTGNASKAEELMRLKQERAELVEYGAEGVDYLKEKLDEVEARITKLEEELSTGLLPAEFTNPDVLPTGAARTLAERRIAMSVTNGVLDFQKLIDQDPRLALAFLSKHVLPYMKRGKYTDPSGKTYDINQLYSATHNSQYISKAEKRTGRESLKRLLDSTGLLGANSGHTINSQVTLETGDARYMLVQVLAELLDNHALASESTFNGSELASFSQIADGMNRDLNVEMAMLQDDLRSAFFRRDQSRSFKGSRSRLLNQTTKGSGKRAQQLDDLSQLAGRSLLAGKIGEDARGQIKAYKESDNVHDQSVGTILEKMAKRMSDNSQYVQDLARRANMLTPVTIDLSGPIPLKLRLDKQQLIKNKGTAYQTFADEVGGLYSRKMVEALEDEGSGTLDTMTLIAAGIIPIESAQKGLYTQNPRKVYDRLLELSEEDNPLIDRRALDDLEKDGLFEDGSSLHRALVDRDAILPPQLRSVLTLEGEKVYKNRVVSFDGLEENQRMFFNAIESDLTKNGPPAMRMSGNTVFNGTADIRQFKYSQRTIATGGTRFDSGDKDYFTISEIFENEVLSEFLEFNPVILSSGMARGIATETADSVNFNRVVGKLDIGTEEETAGRSRKVEVKNLNGRTILKTLEKYTEQVDMPTEVKEQLRTSIRFFEQGRQNVLGYRESFEETGDLFLDGMNAISTPLTLIQFGANLPLTFVAETLASLIPVVGSRTVTRPVRLSSLIGSSLTNGLTKIQKNRVLRQTTVALDTLRNESLSKANINLESDVRSHELGRTDESLFGKTTRLAGGIIGKPAQMMLNFNKGLGGLGAHEDLIRFVSSGSVRRLVAELKAIRVETKALEAESPRAIPEDAQAGKVDDRLRLKESQRRLKRAAKKAGVSYEVAQELQKSGLLEDDVYELMESLIIGGDAERTRVVDLDGSFNRAREAGRRASALYRAARLGDKTKAKKTQLRAEARALQAQSELEDKARLALNTFVKLRIDKYNVEPRVFDRPLLNNTGFNAMQNIFMSWTRAFYDQKSFMGAARTAAAGGPMALAKAYAMFFLWESFYQGLVEISKGKTQEEVMHEMQRDPVFFYMKRAVRAPIVGGSLGSGLLQALIGRAQASDTYRIGKPYYTNSGIPFDPFGNPAEGAFQRTFQTVEDFGEVFSRQIAPEISGYEGRLTKGDLTDRLIKNVAVTNSVIGRILYNTYFKERNAKEEFDYRRRKNMHYLDLDQQVQTLKKIRNEKRLKILEQIEERRRR